ncbi:response regulator [Halospeciosus flavus]
MSIPPIQLSEETRSTAWILVVSADEGWRNQVGGAFGGEEYDVATASSMATARHQLGQQFFEAVVTDSALLDGTGLELLAEVRAQQPDAACVLYTDLDSAAIDTSEQPDIVINYINETQPNALEVLLNEVETMVETRAHTSYPLPYDEDERLAVLDRYLDVVSEVAISFKHLTRTAEEELDVDVSFVGLVGRYTEDIVACRGIDWGVLNREETVCTYGVLEDGPTVIEDLTADPRFERLNFVTEYNLRSYAGAP